MRVPSKKMMERILECHTGKKIRVSNEAAKLMFLHYLIFLRKLAKECDNFSFRQRKMQISGDAVSFCSPKLLSAFCETEKILTKPPKSMKMKITPANQQKKKSEEAAEEMYDTFDESDDLESISEDEEK
ncbi:uncharacterized protein [Panulirus ornatus]|uniref:uncharacterized protein n=1 Tax=Panulirus ornatus TaxID=150431 RepID=UPI003A851421